MTSHHSEKDSIIKTGFLAIFGGLVIGVFYVWYEWSWRNLLSGIAAGIGLTLMVFIMTVILKLSTEGWRLYALSAVAGSAAGLAWWLVSKTHASIFIPVIIGGVAAPVATWLETRK